MKNGILKLFSIIFLPFIFFSCNFSAKQKLEYDRADSNKAYITISLEDCRSILPVIDYNNMDNVILTAKKDGEAPVELKKWNSKNAAINERVLVELGNYEFILTAQVNGCLFRSCINKEIKPGDNELSFNLQLVSYPITTNGKGSISVPLSFTRNDNISKVEAVLLSYPTGNEIERKELTVFQNSGKYNVSYNKTGCKSGSYLLKFIFYLDNEKKVFINEYTEIVTVADNLTSQPTKAILIDVYNAVYTIKYELNEGTWTGAGVVPTSYSIYENLNLPDSSMISREGYLFAGWHRANNFKDSSVTVQDCNRATNETYYAEWMKYDLTGLGEADYTFNLSGASSVTHAKYDFYLYSNTTEFIEDENKVYDTTQRGNRKIYSGDSVITGSKLNIKTDKVLPDGVYRLEVTFYNNAEAKVGNIENSTYCYLVSVIENKVNTYSENIDLTRNYENFVFKDFGKDYYFKKGVFVRLYHNGGDSVLPLPNIDSYIAKPADDILLAYNTNIDGNTSFVSYVPKDAVITPVDGIRYFSLKKYEDVPTDYIRVTGKYIMDRTDPAEYLDVKYSFTVNGTAYEYKRLVNYEIDYEIDSAGKKVFNVETIYTGFDNRAKPLYASLQIFNKDCEYEKSIPEYIYSCRRSVKESSYVRYFNTNNLQEIVYKNIDSVNLGPDNFAIFPAYYIKGVKSEVLKRADFMIASTNVLVGVYDNEGCSGTPILTIPATATGAQNLYLRVRENINKSVKTGDEMLTLKMKYRLPNDSAIKSVSTELYFKMNTHSESATDKNFCSRMEPEIKTDANGRYIEIIEEKLSAHDYISSSATREYCILINLCSDTNCSVIKEKVHKDVKLENPITEVNY